VIIGRIVIFMNAMRAESLQKINCSSWISWKSSKRQGGAWPSSRPFHHDCGLVEDGYEPNDLATAPGALAEVWIPDVADGRAGGAGVREIPARPPRYDLGGDAEGGYVDSGYAHGDVAGPNPEWMDAGSRRA
jgi:hypothetical protein